MLLVSELYHISKKVQNELNLTYKVRNELKITKSKELESVFIEIQNNHKRKNVIAGCIY